MFVKRKKKSTAERLGIVLGVLFGIILGAAIKRPFIGIIIGVILGISLGKRFDAKMKGKQKENVVNIPKMPSIKFNFSILIYIIILLAILYYFRPWFHGFVMGIYTRPLLVLFILFAILAGAAFSTRNLALAGIAVFLAAASFVALGLNDVILERYIVDELQYNIIDELPDSTQLRILPKAVAWRYLEDSLQKSRERIGGLDIVNINNSFVWTAPRIPDGVILYFTQKVNGLMIADATKIDRTTRMVSDELSVGEGIGITDNVYWQLYKRHYLMNIDEIYYVMQDDDIYTVAPIIKYRFKFPVMIPYFAGVFVAKADGTIDFYTPEDAASVKMFSNNWIFPESLARLYVDAYKYHLGILNAWFLHKDQIEISDVYGQQNRQPFLMPTVKGLKWIVATEPWGESYGVFKIFFVDALTGKIELMEMNEDKTLTGPVRVVSYVKKKFPIIDWATSRVVEPRPYVIDSVLYWMLSITPYDFAGISYTVFVNSMNNEVTPFEKERGVFAFVQGEEIVTEEITETKDETLKDKIKEMEDLLNELKEMVEVTE